MQFLKIEIIRYNSSLFEEFSWENSQSEFTITQILHFELRSIYDLIGWYIGEKNKWAVSRVGS
jgi:hypothetical protein